MIIEDLVESLIDHRSSGRTSDSSQKILLQYTAKYKDRKAQVSQYVETGEVNSSLERKVKFRIPENDNRPSSRGSFRVKEPNHFVVPKGLYHICGKSYKRFQIDAAAVQIDAAAVVLVTHFVMHLKASSLYRASPSLTERADDDYYSRSMDSMSVQGTKAGMHKRRGLSSLRLQG